MIQISEKFYDLSHVINLEMEVYPGDPIPYFQKASSIESDGFNVTKITMGTHTGTHVDAQSHFLLHGRTIDKEPLTKFIGECITIDFSTINRGITYDDFELISNKLSGEDIVLIYTGSGKIISDNDKDKLEFIYLEPSAAEWLLENNIKCVGIDTLSVEKYGSIEGKCHKMLLSNNTGIIENLNSNLKYLVNRKSFLVCLPLSFEGLDGSPSRVIAFDILNK